MPQIVKFNRGKKQPIIFVNLDAMSDLSVGTVDSGEGVILKMMNGDTFPLDTDELKMVLATLYGTRSDMLLKALGI